MPFSQSASSTDQLNSLNATPALVPASSITPELPRLDRSASLLFVDKGVSDYESLIQGAQPGTEVHVLDPAQDAVAQISQTLLGRTGISSLQILSHGQAGALQLGQDWLNLATLQRDVTQLQSWKGALTEDADILLYGCNVAQGELGQAFVSILSQLTGADVAASDDVTGRGGDWTLEVNTGDIEAATVFTTGAMQRYQGALAPPVVVAITEADTDNTVATTVPLNYTVTFDQAIDATTVTPADFVNAGDATITVNGITEVTPSVFTVSVTPTSPGSLQLKIDKDAAGSIANMTGDLLNASFTDDDTLTVIPFNTAPVFNPDLAANPTSIVEDVVPFRNTGTLISDLLGTSVTDPDTGALQGIAVTSVDSSSGTWQYSIDNGNSWITFTATSTTARLLAADAKLQFTPNPNYYGSANITFRAWDRTSGINGQTADASTFTGGITAFSDLAASKNITIRPVNDRPSFTAPTPAPAINEDANPLAQSIANWATFDAGVFNELANGQTPTYVISNITNPGLFDVAPAIAADGTLTYTPNANANGTTAFTVVVMDNGGTTDNGKDTSVSQTFNLTINSVNDAPDFTATNPVAIREDAGAQTVNNWAVFNAGPANEVSQTATYTVTGVTAGFFASAPAIDASGNLTYTVNPNVFGTGNFSVQVQDSGGTTNGGVNVSAVKNFSITVDPINDKPDFTAATTLTAINEDAAAQTVSNWATFNPGNPEEIGQAPTYLVSDISRTGFFEVPPAVDVNGNLTYKVAANADGTVTFKVQAQDSGGTANGGVNLSDAKTISLTVNSINDRPSFTVPTPLAPINEDAGDQSLSGWAVFDSGAAAEIQTPTYTVTAANPAFFTTQPTIDATGQLTFKVADHVFGSVTFDVTVNDGGGTANGGLDTSLTQTFTLTVNSVNDKPTFTAPVLTPIAEGAGAQSVTGWATFDAGVANESGQTAIAYIVTNIRDAATDTPNASFFALAPSINPSTGTLTYTVNENAFGSVKFDVQVRDSGGTTNGGINLSDVQTFTLTVDSVNDAPDFDALDPAVINEGAGAQTLTNWATFFAGAPNEATQTASYTVTTSNDAFFSVLPSITPDGTLTYTVEPDTFGDVTLSVTVADNGAPSASSATKTFTLTVNAVNDKPILTAVDPAAIQEGAGTQTLTNWGTFTPGPTNEAGQTALSYSVSNITNASLFEVPPSIAADGTLTYKANSNASGIATFEVRVRDSGGTANGGIDTSDAKLITITVTGINDKPTFVANDRTVLEDAPAQTIANWSTFFAGAADEASQTATYTVNNISDSTFFATAPSVAPDGTLSYTLNPDVNGTVTFDVQVRDSGGTANVGDIDTSDIQTFTLTVTPVNDEPDFTAPALATILEGAGPQNIANWTTFDAGPTDEASQTATYLISNISDPNFFATGPAIAADGTLTYAVNTNITGTVTFDVQVQDSGGTANNGVNLSAVKTFTLAVTGVNDAPDFNATNPATVLEDATAQTIANWASFTAGPADEVSQTATYTVNNISDSTFFATAPSVTPDGTLSYTLNPDVNGTVTFDVQVQDSGGTLNGGVDLSAVKSFSLTVTAVNDEPDFTAVVPAAILEGAGLQTLTNWATFDAGPTDEASQTATYLISNISNASLFETPPEIAADGTLTYKANANASGTSTFDVQVRDSGGTANGGDDLSTIKTFTITVTGVNDQPEFFALDPDVILEDAGVQTLPDWADFFAGAVDEASQTALYSVTNISDSTFFAVGPSIAPDGTLTYRVADNVFGDVTFDVTVQDNGGTANGGIDTSAVQTFTISVTGVNDAPTFTAVEPATIEEGAGLQTLTGWASFDPGNTQEAVQTVLSYDVRNLTNAALFDIAPLVANDGTLTYTPKADAFGTATFDLVVMDDGGTDNGGVNTSTVQTFTITINGVNDRPDFTATNPPAVNEDAGVQSLPGWATFNPGVNEASQTAEYTVSNLSDPTLFDIGPAIDATGKLTYTPKLNAFGTATFDLVVRDSGGTANGGIDTSVVKSFTITVNSVNDAPSFVKGTDQTIFTSEGAQSIANWATGFNAGAPNENTQTLTEYIIVSNDNPSLFAAAPTIADDGTLSYAPATNLTTAGTAKIGVRVRDDGGTANGGVDLSEIQYFNITVKPTTVGLLATDAIASEATPVIDTGVYQVKRDYSVGEMTINLTVDPSSTATLNDYALSINPTVGTLTQTGSTITVTLNDGISQADILLTSVDDTSPEPNETLKLMVANGTGYAIDATHKEGVVTIQANDPIASITPVRTNLLEGDSGTVAHTFTIKLSNTLDQAVTVNYSTLNGTATAGSDYVASTGSVVFAPGQTEETITVLSNADAIEEANETFQVKLDTVSAGTISTTAGTATGVIRDDDAKTSFRFSAATFSTPEGNDKNTTRAVTIKRGGNLSVSSSVQVRLTSGTAIAGKDFVNEMITVTFAAGQDTATVPIQVLGDRQYGAQNESLTMNLVSINPDATVEPTQPQATLTLVNDDRKPAFNGDYKLSTRIRGGKKYVVVTRTGDQEDFKFESTIYCRLNDRSKRKFSFKAGQTEMLLLATPERIVSKSVGVKLYTRSTGKYRMEERLNF